MDYTVSLKPYSSFRRRMVEAVKVEMADLKYRDIADAMGVHPSRVSQIMNDSTNLSLNTLQRLLLAGEKVREGERSC